MIKMYTPNALIKAGLEVKKKHSKADSAYTNISDHELRELVMYITGLPTDEIKNCKNLLSKRQKYILAEYIPRNRFNVDCKNIETVLTECMDDEIYKRLFLGWQHYPENDYTVNILSQSNIKNDEMNKNLLDSNFFKKLINERIDVVRYYTCILNTVILRFDKSRIYEENYSNLGLKNETPLYKTLYSVYLAEGSLNVMKKEGDISVSQAINYVRDQKLKKNLICKILLFGYKNNTELIPFRETYRCIYNFLGEPNMEKISSFGKNYMKIYDTYCWWYNYQSLVEGFNHDADQRRIKFWMEYIGNCLVYRLKDKKFLILKFAKYSVVESETIGTLYIFENDYYEKVVNSYLRLNSAAEGKSWMKQYGEPVYSKTHRGRWELDVPNEMKRLNMI